MAVPIRIYNFDFTSVLNINESSWPTVGGFVSSTLSIGETRSQGITRHEFTSIVGWVFLRHVVLGRAPQGSVLVEDLRIAKHSRTCRLGAVLRAETVVAVPLEKRARTADSFSCNQQSRFTSKESHPKFEKRIPIKCL